MTPPIIELLRSRAASLGMEHGARMLAVSMPSDTRATGALDAQSGGMAVIERLKARSQELRMRDREVAVRAGLSNRSVRNIFAGVADPRLSIVCRLCDALGVLFDPLVNLQGRTMVNITQGTGLDRKAIARLLRGKDCRLSVATKVAAEVGASLGFIALPDYHRTMAAQFGLAVELPYFWSMPPLNQRVKELAWIVGDTKGRGDGGQRSDPLTRP